jgi:hypothetical protein
MLVKSSSCIVLVCNANEVGWLYIRLQRSAQKKGNGSGNKRDRHTDIGNSSRSVMVRDGRCGWGAGRSSRSGSSAAADHEAARGSSRARGNDRGADACGGSWSFRSDANQRLGDGVGKGRSDGVVCGDKLGRSQAEHGRDNGVDLHIEGILPSLYTLRRLMLSTRQRYSYESIEVSLSVVKDGESDAQESKVCKREIRTGTVNCDSCARLTKVE